jgi:membrane fusion protein
MAVEFRSIPALSGQVQSIPLGLNNRGWAPVTGFIAVSVAVALVYANIATYARKERVSGYLAPREGMARVAAPQPGILTHLYVKNGDVVKEGDPLFTLDTSHALAGGGTLDEAVAAGLRRQLALLDEQIAAEAQRVRSEVERLDSRVAGLAQQRVSLDMQRQFQVQRAAVTEERLKSLSELRGKGYVSEAEYRAREESWLSQRQNLAAIEQNITALSAELAQARIERERAPLDSADRLSRLSASQAELRQRLAETDAQRGRVVHASMGGRVMSLQAGVGQRLDPAKPVLALLKDGSELQAELYVPSRAIGFVKPGQQVRLMYDAFPYQHFGTFGGTVESVSQAMSMPQEVNGPIQPKEPSYRVTVNLESENKNSLKANLNPEMTLNSDIILERKNIVSFMVNRFISYNDSM